MCARLAVRVYACGVLPAIVLLYAPSGDVAVALALDVLGLQELWDYYLHDQMMLAGYVFVYGQERGRGRGLAFPFQRRLGVRPVHTPDPPSGPPQPSLSLVVHDCRSRLWCWCCKAR